MIKMSEDYYYKILVHGLSEEELAQVKKLCDKHGWPYDVERSRPRAPITTRKTTRK
jgi:hypothetical protein